MSVEIRVPEMGESIVEATVGTWLKAEGDAVATGEAVLELETEKVNLEVTAPGHGVLEKILKSEGETVTVDEVLGMIAEEAARPAEQEAVPEKAAEPAAVQQDTPARAAPANGAQATPVASRVAAEHGVDISAIRGTGPGGRITRKDVEDHIGAVKTQPIEALAPAAEARPTVTPTHHPGDRPEERVRLSRRRQTIARRLVEAQQTAVMTTTYNEIDMSAVMDLRQRRRAEFKQKFGMNLGFMSFFVKASVGALKDFPRLNAELHGDELILKRFYDLGIAIASDEGLVVPVLRDADTRSFAEIEEAIVDMAARTRERKLTLEELQGGTFSITNGGVFGSLMSTPLLNPPQVGILGMHRIQERPTAVGGQVVIRPMMYVAVTYDHRIVDGGEAVQFLVRIKELVEDPGRLLLNG